MATDADKLKVGKGETPSPSIESVTKNSWNAQKPGTEGQTGVNDALAQQYNKKPVPAPLK